MSPVPPLGTETGVLRDMVVEPPRLTLPPPVNPVPAVTVNAFDVTTPAVTVKLVALKLATPFCVLDALAIVNVTVDPAAEVLMP